MEFTFSDYAFSGLLSILAALYGVGYPLIIQSIEKIYTQYKSLSISDRFIKEPIYSVFQVLLVINLVFAISAPFLLHWGWNNNLFITIQAILLVILVGQTFLLFRLILIYSTAPKLLKHMEKTQIDKHNLISIFDLAIYADAIHSYPLYHDCMEDVFGYISKQQGDENGQSASIILPPVYYDGLTSDIVSYFSRYVKDNDGHHYLNRQNDIVAVFFNINSKSRISEQGRSFMWRLVNDAISSKNKPWFSQYWQYAESYENFKYHNLLYSQKELKTDKEWYRTHHVMTGTALIHWGRFVWLNDIFFYTHFEPEYYGLIPSSFPSIIHEMRKLSELVDNPYIPWPYYFSDSMIGATDEKRIFRESIRYLSLLVIRLWSLKDRYISDTKIIFSHPEFPVELEKEEQEIRLLDNMKKDIEEWERRIIFRLIPNLTPIEIDRVIEFVEEYRIGCQRDIQNKKEHPIVSKKKFDVLMERTISAVKEFNLNLPSIPLNSKISYKQVSTSIVFSDDINTIHYSDYVQMGGAEEIGLLGWKNFTYELYRGYLDLLKMMPCLKSTVACRSQLSDLFDMMGITSEYTVVLTDDVEDCPQKDVILETYSRPLRIIILPKLYLPHVELEPIKTDGTEPIVDGMAFCSNIGQFISCRDPLYKMRFATKMKGQIRDDSPGYVQIVIDDSQLDGGKITNISWQLDDLFKHS